eukprot:14861178-Alexandrium_andersonii.AAC.1
MGDGLGLMLFGWGALFDDWALAVSVVQPRVPRLCSECVSSRVVCVCGVPSAMIVVSNPRACAVSWCEEFQECPEL